MQYTKILLVTLFAFSYATVDEDSDSNYDGYWDNFSANLNRNINNRVRKGLEGLDNLGPRISQQVHDNLKGLDDLGPRISQQVNDNLKGLDNLGSRISEQVYEGLRPVREMESRFRVKYGNGGTTIANFQDKKFILRNGVMYECNGAISEADGTCSGTLRKPNFSNKKDFCYANVNTIINNWYCIGTGSVNSGSINGRVYCDSADGSPTLLISEDEYSKLCRNIGPVSYKYFSDQPLGDHSSDVQCSGTGPYVCTMSEAHGVRSAGSYVYIN